MSLKVWGILLVHDELVIAGGDIICLPGANPYAIMRQDSGYRIDTWALSRKRGDPLAGFEVNAMTGITVKTAKKWLKAELGRRRKIEVWRLQPNKYIKQMPSEFILERLGISPRKKRAKENSIFSLPLPLP